jgi:hypothetical protein
MQAVALGLFVVLQVAAGLYSTSPTLLPLLVCSIYKRPQVMPVQVEGFVAAHK